MLFYASLLACACIILWSIFTYNSFVGLLRLADEAWSGISIQLKRRNDLIPNLVETVKGYTAYEAGVLEEVTRLRADVLRELGANAASSNLAKADEALSQALGRVLVVAEAYPKLKAESNFLALQRGLAEVEDALQMSRRYYNGSVRNYKIKRESFPSLLIGKIFNFGDRPFFVLDNAVEAETPRIAM